MFVAVFAGLVEADYLDADGGVDDYADGEGGIEHNVLDDDVIEGETIFYRVGTSAGQTDRSV